VVIPAHRMPSRSFGALALVASTLAPTTAAAQIGFSGGIDGGFSIASPDQQLLDPAARADDAKPTIALGIDLAGYWMPTPRFGVGLALAPAFFTAGTGSTAGIDFAVAPRVVWRLPPVRFTAEAGLVVSAYNDLCVADFEDRAPGCTLVRPAEPAGIGFGAALSALLPVWQEGDNVFIEVGPVLLYHHARFDYEDGQGSFSMPLFQAAVALRGFVHAED
jgi:hypothetical protein